MHDIPESLIINWDQTGLSIVPNGDWTMEKEGTNIVPIAHNDDKRQLTAVLAITAATYHSVSNPTNCDPTTKILSTVDHVPNVQ